MAGLPLPWTTPEQLRLKRYVNIVPYQGMYMYMDKKKNQDLLLGGGEELSKVIWGNNMKGAIKVSLDPDHVLFAFRSLLDPDPR
jgi:hypothetical protein